MPGLERGNEVDNFVGRYRAHDAELEGHPLELAQILGQFFCLISGSVDKLEVRANHLTEIGEMREMALAMEKRPAELALQLLDGARERGLRDVGLLRGAREVQFLCDGEKITDLVHFHGATRWQ